MDTVLQANAPVSASKGSVLLVDDDKFLLDMYSVKFTQSGYQVHACTSVASALEYLHGGLVPDAVIFDIVMPERTGFSLLESLRDEHLVPNAVRAALTNQSDPEEQKRATDLGVDCFLVKATMIPSEVVAKIGEEIHKKKTGGA
jgi:CheY-like chemotaxis protein